MMGTMGATGLSRERAKQHLRKITANLPQVTYRGISLEEFDADDLRLIVKLALDYEQRSKERKEKRRT